MSATPRSGDATVPVEYATALAAKGTHAQGPKHAPRGASVSVVKNAAMEAGRVAPWTARGPREAGLFTPLDTNPFVPLATSPLAFFTTGPSAPIAAERTREAGSFAPLDTNSLVPLTARQFVSLVAERTWGTECLNAMGPSAAMGARVSRGRGKAVRGC